MATGSGCCAKASCNASHPPARNAKGKLLASITETSMLSTITSPPSCFLRHLEADAVGQQRLNSLVSGKRVDRCHESKMHCPVSNLRRNTLPALRTTLVAQPPSSPRDPMIPETVPRPSLCHVTSACRRHFSNTRRPSAIDRGNSFNFVMIQGESRGLPSMGSMETETPLSCAPRKAQIISVSSRRRRQIRRRYMTRKKRERAPLRNGSPCCGFCCNRNPIISRRNHLPDISFNAHLDTTAMTRRPVSPNPWGEHLSPFQTDFRLPSPYCVVTAGFHKDLQGGWPATQCNSLAVFSAAHVTGRPAPLIHYELYNQIFLRPSSISKLWTAPP